MLQQNVLDIFRSTSLDVLTAKKLQTNIKNKKKIKTDEVF